MLKNMVAVRKRDALRQINRVWPWLLPIAWESRCRGYGCQEYGQTGEHTQASLGFHLRLMVYVGNAQTAFCFRNPAATSPFYFAWRCPTRSSDLAADNNLVQENLSSVTIKISPHSIGQNNSSITRLSRYCMNRKSGAVAKSIEFKETDKIAP